MSHDPEIPSLGKRPREIVTQALKVASIRMYITEDGHCAIIGTKKWHQCIFKSVLHF